MKREGAQMTSESKTDPFQSPLPKPMQERFPLRRRSLRGLWWALTTQAQKRRILWEDRRGRFGYSQWIKTVERDRVQTLLRQAEKLPRGEDSALFLIIGGEWSEKAVSRTIQSFRGQPGAWQAAIVLPEDSSLLQEHWFKALLEADARTHLITPDGAMRQFAWTPRINEIMSLYPGNWVIPLCAGDVLAQYWTDLFAFYVQGLIDADIVYWDEDHLSAGGERVQPFFKPDWSPETLLSINYLGSAAFRRNFLQSLCDSGRADPVGWIFNVTAAARQIVHLPLILQHCQILPSEDRERSLAGHAEGARAALQRRGCANASAVATPGGALSLHWTAESPLVSIIIPTKNNLNYLQRCLNSLMERTAGVPFEVILMDDHSSEPVVKAYYQEMARRYDAIRIIPNEGEFNYSAVNNAGARLAHGDLLLFLNNDVEALDTDWLAEMVRWADMPGVGIVGAKLLYPDGRIQHAGIVVGMTGHAGHLYAGQREITGPSLFFSPEMVRNVSAVTGACMMIRRELFTALGGFDEDLVLAFSDVDLSLRVLRSGYRVVYTPAAKLTHYEGRSRAHYIPPRDIRRGAERLLEEVQAGDRYYNPALSLAVNYPSFRRPFEPSGADRLKYIIQFKG